MVCNPLSLWPHGQSSSGGISLIHGVYLEQCYVNAIGHIADLSGASSFWNCILSLAAEDQLIN